MVAATDLVVVVDQHPQATNTNEIVLYRAESGAWSATTVVAGGSSNSLQLMDALGSPTVVLTREEGQAVLYDPSGDTWQRQVLGPLDTPYKDEKSRGCAAAIVPPALAPMLVLAALLRRRRQESELAQYRRSTC